jgi:hypothetical protein
MSNSYHEKFVAELLAVIASEATQSRAEFACSPRARFIVLRIARYDNSGNYEAYLYFENTSGSNQSVDAVLVIPAKAGTHFCRGYRPSSE